MKKIKTCVIVICLAMLLNIGGAAWGRTPNDNTIDGATTIAPDETASDTVGPRDEVDYYTIEILPGSTVSGTVTLLSQQEGTTLRITGSDYTIFAKRTTDEISSLVYLVPEEGVEPGVYYIRVGYHPSYKYAHEYTLTMDLTITRLIETGIDTPIAVMPPDEIFTRDFYPLELEQTVPWSSLNCGATYRRWSTYPGPSGEIEKVASFIVPDDLGLAPDQDEIFGSLVAGYNDRIYCVGDWTLTAYDISSGFLWEYGAVPVVNPCYLDGDGNIYLIGLGQKNLVCLDPDGNTLWSYAAPEDQHWPYFPGVGKRVYVARIDGLDTYVDVLDKDGNFLHTLGPGGSHIMVEDPNAAVYFQTGLGLYQFGWDGTLNWYAELPDPADWRDFGLRTLQPLVGRDHKIWLESPYQRRVYIYNPDGTLYHSYSYNELPGNEPTAVCYGSNHKLYIATKDNRLKCYSDWTTELWDVALPGAIGEHSMIMGSDNKIYIHFTTMPTMAALIIRHCLGTINPDTGEMYFNTVIVDMPDRFLGKERNELAIGEDNRLIYLNGGGYITVYEPRFLRYMPDMRLEKTDIKETGGQRGG